MSLGFLTESALMPSQGKKIQVDGRSLVGLKALVFEQEEKLKLSRESEDGGSSSRGWRGKRSATAAALDSEQKARKDIFTRTNRGVDERLEKDELTLDDKAMTAKQREQKASKTLKAKAKLYQKLARGEVQGAEAGGLLVDFGTKTQEELDRLEKGEESDDGKNDTSSNSRSTHKQQHNTGYDSDDVDIVDEFGRDVVVKRGSKEHKEYKRLLKAGVTSSTAAQRSHSNSNAAASSTTGSSTNQQWAWGSGQRSSSNTSNVQEVEDIDGCTLRGRRNIEALIDSMGRDDSSSKGAAAPGPQVGEVKTTHFRLRNRWETQLGQGEKDYIDELRQETAGARAKEEERREARQARLDLMKKKADERRQRALGL